MIPVPFTIALWVAIVAFAVGGVGGSVATIKVTGLWKQRAEVAELKRKLKGVAEATQLSDNLEDEAVTAEEANSRVMAQINDLIQKGIARNATPPAPVPAGDPCHAVFDADFMRALDKLR